ncbi:MAG: 50S ribosomal protein L19e [Candidatus Pacearchaeota archaeon]
MKTLKTQRRMAAKVLNVGENRIWMDPERLSEIKEAITKLDIEDLIKEKAIKKKPARGFKKRAHKERLKRKKKGRRRNIGKRKKKIIYKKGGYVKKIRKLRAFLKKIKNMISREEYKKIKKLIRGGQIKEIKDLQARIKK